MAESFSEYRERVLGYLGERDPLAVLQQTPARLERLVGSVSRAAAVRRPRPGKWSILEIVSHMADAELAFGWRVRNMLATPGAPERGRARGVGGGPRPQPPAPDRGDPRVSDITTPRYVANVVATCLAHGVAGLVTANVGDFEHFESRVEVNPLGG